MDIQVGKKVTRKTKRTHIHTQKKKKMDLKKKENTEDISMKKKGIKRR